MARFRIHRPCRRSVRLRPCGTSTASSIQTERVLEVGAVRLFLRVHGQLVQLRGTREEGQVFEGETWRGWREAASRGPVLKGAEERVGQLGGGVVGQESLFLPEANRVSGLRQPPKDDAQLRHHGGRRGGKEWERSPAEIPLPGLRR